MGDLDPFMQANRARWDEKVPIHLRNRTGFYGIDDFKAGSDILSPIEAAEIGDLSGKRLVHLQCHFGLDTLALVRRGASVTGVDFSGPAVAAARALAAETGLAAHFVEANVYDAVAATEGPFDAVYTTWGTIGWLPDIRRWAEVVAGLLAPGGFVYLADHHPILTTLEQEGDELVFRYPWRSDPTAPLSFEEAKTYTGDEDVLLNSQSYEWSHPFSSLLTGLVDAGFRLAFLREHESIPWQAFPMMVPAGGRGMYRLPDGHPGLPLSFSLKAIRV